MNAENFEHTLQLTQQMEESPVKARLKLFIIDYLGIPVSEFENSIGVSNAFVSKIRKSISEDKLERITKKYTMLNPAWLMLGIGDMLKTPTFDSPRSILDSKFLEGILLPVYDVWNQIGIKSILRAMEENLIIEHLAVPGTLGCIGWVKMKGDYMFDFIKDGEYISLREQEFNVNKIDYGSVYYVEFKDGRDPVIRYLKKGDSGNFVLRCQNAKYDDILVDPSLIQGIFKVENINRRV